MVDDSEQRWEGRGEHLHSAIEDAWNQAKRGGAEPGTYVVEAIAFEASNPIHSYIVIISPPGD
jgi:hypothetical protein